MTDKIERIKAMLAQNEGDGFLQHALALEYVKLGDDTAAKTIFEGLLAKDENYVGSYYHLGKLLERVGEKEAALAVYEKGMAVAKRLNENHAYGELRGALEEAED